jgi:hypothetical protein
MQNYLAGNFPLSRSCLPEIYCILLFYIHFTVLQGYILYCEDTGRDVRQVFKICTSIKKLWSNKKSLVYSLR